MVGNMRKPHAVVFPIPMQGHINPMMLLAKHLHSSGIRVTFLLTERTLSILQHNNSVAHKDGHNNDNHGNNCCGAAEGGVLPNNNKDTNNSTINVDDGHNDYNKNNNNNNNEYINNKIKTSKNGGDIDNSDDIEDNGGSIDNSDNVEDDDAGNHHSKQNATTDDGSNKSYPHDGDILYNNATSQGHNDENGGYVDVCDVDNIPPIQFETLPDCSSSHDHTLPMSTYVLMFLNSVSLLQRKLEEILKRLQQRGHPATCIISDSFVPWTQDVANEFGIPRMEFWSSSVTVYAMGYHIPQLISKGYLPAHPGADPESCIDIIPGLATFRLADFFYDSNPHAISSPVFDLISKAFSRAKEAQRVLVNSFYELEKDITDALRADGVAIDPIGPLLPLQLCSSTHATQLQRGDTKTMGTSLYADDDDCLAWLDTQAESSVIYVSFGSMAIISKEEMEELILGLENSQQPYLLVMRPGMVSGGCAQMPLRGKKGRICRWVPQIHVLGHPAVGGFLTHCGWNSIMEGMYMGVPMIGCQRESEQHTNLKYLRDEWKVAIGLDHDVCERKKEVTKKVQEMKKELVERAVRILMQEEEGVALRKRMAGLQEAAKRAAHHASSVPLLIHHLKHGHISN